MDMGLLVWDGRVWVCWIDRWVWVVGVFSDGGGLGGGGGYGFAALRCSSLLGWEWQRGRERKKYNWRIKKEYLNEMVENIECLMVGVL